MLITEQFVNLCIVIKWQAKGNFRIQEFYLRSSLVLENSTAPQLHWVWNDFIEDLDSKKKSWPQPADTNPTSQWDVEVLQAASIQSRLYDLKSVLDTDKTKLVVFSTTDH